MSQLCGVDVLSQAQAVYVFDAMRLWYNGIRMHVYSALTDGNAAPKISRVS